MSDVVIIMTTVADEAAARRIASSLIEARLAACVQILPGLTSVYRWEGKVCEDAELLLLVKTTTDKSTAVRERVAEIHPYDVPELITVPASEVSEPYRAWMSEVLG